jgi:1-deoxy-D-xylulose-5-phosphate reductoisomerase
MTATLKNDSGGSVMAMTLEAGVFMDEVLFPAATRKGRSQVQTVRRIAVLGCSGSIGSQTLDVVANLGPQYEITALAAATSWKTLANQARKCNPKVIALSDGHKHAADLAAAVADLPVQVLHGPDALVDIAKREDVDTVVAAVVGAAGLRPVIAAAECGKTIALANKEALVVAGSIVMPAARRHKATVLPVDSEHSAIFQALRSGTAPEIRKIILTASGGPFRTWPASKIQNATVDEALAHPNWKMGPKITIDSATMMNKALEIIEAHWLFDLPAEKIEVLIHPQSIVHSMIEFVDGSVIAQLGTPDMRTPIQYALTHPDRVDGCSTRLDWSKIKEMTFEQPDERFPALQLGFEVIRLGGTSGAVVNAANEAANALFRAGKIKFGEIVKRVQTALEKHKRLGFIAHPTLQQLLAADAWARQEIAE